MKKNGFATKTITAVAAGLAVGAIGFAAPAVAAPTGPGNAQQTISEFEAEGFRVIVSRLSNSPLDQANVVSVRQGQTYTQNRLDRDNDVYQVTTGRTVYVTVK